MYNCLGFRNQVRELANEKHSTKNRILDTAKKLALNNDFESLSIRDICREANISIGAFYHHFSSKEEMINESFLIYDLDLDLRLKQYDQTNPLIALKSLLLDQTTFVSSFPYKLVVEYYRAILSSTSKGAINKKRTYYKAVDYFVGVAIESKKFSSIYTRDYLTNFFIKHIRGNLLHWCMNPEMDIVNQTSYELDLLFNMFSNEKTLGDIS